MGEIQSDKAPRRSLVGALVAALAASVCCVGPLVLLTLGVGGAWIGSLTALEPYRPYFMLVAVLLLAYAFYRVYRQPKEGECEPGSLCENLRSNRINKIALWTVTGLVVVLLAVPYLTPLLSATRNNSADTERAIVEPENSALCTDGALPAESGQYEKAVLKVANMTCSSCQVTVEQSLTRLDGVVETRVELENNRAVVKYLPDKVNPAKLIEATTEAGFPSSLEK